MLGGSFSTEGGPLEWLCLQPVLNQRTADRCEHRFGVKLHASHIVPSMSQGHDSTVVIFGRDFELFGEVLVIDDPAMVSTRFEGFG